MRFYSIAHRIRLFFSRTVHTETPENAHLIDSTRIRRFFRRRFRSIAHRICFFFSPNVHTETPENADGIDNTRILKTLFDAFFKHL